MANGIKRTVLTVAGILLSVGVPTAVTLTYFSAMVQRGERKAPLGRNTAYSAYLRGTAL